MCGGDPHRTPGTSRAQVISLAGPRVSRAVSSDRLACRFPARRSEEEGACAGGQKQSWLRTVGGARGRATAPGSKGSSQNLNSVQPRVFTQPCSVQREPDKSGPQ